MESQPATPPTPTGRATLASRLGLPRLRGHGGFVGANAIDSLGNGLVLAFTVVYFARTTTLSLPEVGAALSAARLLGLPAALGVGPVLDRFGARTVAAAGNLMSAVGFTGFFFAHSVWQIVVVVLIAQLGNTTYWTSSSALVVLAAQGGERTRWFGFVRALRNMGLGVGGAVGSVAVALGGVGGLRAVVVANAVSYVAAATMLTLWRPAPAPVESPPSSVSTAQPPTEAATAAAEPAAAVRKDGYLTVLRDGRYMMLVAINVTFVFAAMLNSVLMAIYITVGLHRGVWLAGSLLVLNTVQVALMQTVISARLERFRGTRVIAVSCLINALAFGLFAVLDVSPGWMVVTGLFLAMFIYTIAEITATPPTNDLSVALAPAHIRGRYLAVYQLSWTLGQAVAPGLLTLLLVHGAMLPWAFLGGISLLAVPMVLVLERQITREKASREIVPMIVGELADSA